MPSDAFRTALVLIARNESRAIARCLNSIRPYVDEMVVLDTGSSDSTASIAKACGAAVHHFEWVDDFSAARNAALDLTQADWRIVLDADEWLESGADALGALRRTAPEFLGLISVASTVEHGATRAPSWLPRMLPRGVRYTGRIHEQPDSQWPRRRLAVTVGHDGYLAAQMARKAGRNRTLLERSLADCPGDVYLQYQLGKDHEVASEFALALPFYRRAYEGVSEQASWRHDLVLRLLFALGKTGNSSEALAIARAEQPRWQDSPDFHFTLGDLLLECALREPQHGPEWLPQIEANWLRAIEIGERPELPDSVLGRGSFLAAHNLAVLHESLGNHDGAHHWRQEVARMRSAHAVLQAGELAGRPPSISAIALAAEP